MQQNIKDTEIYAELDKQFDRCIDHFIRENIIYTQEIKNYTDKIDTEITLFLELKSIEMLKFQIDMMYDILKNAINLLFQIHKLDFLIKYEMVSYYSAVNLIYL